MIEKLEKKGDLTIYYLKKDYSDKESSEKLDHFLRRSNIKTNNNIIYCSNNI